MGIQPNLAVSPIQVSMSTDKGSRSPIREERGKPIKEKKQLVKPVQTQQQLARSGKGPKNPVITKWIGKQNPSNEASSSQTPQQSIGQLGNAKPTNAKTVEVVQTKDNTVVVRNQQTPGHNSNQITMVTPLPRAPKEGGVHKGSLIYAACINVVQHGTKGLGASDFPPLVDGVNVQSGKKPPDERPPKTK
ncbi:hypothetical protein K7X08_035843 [Anisodus acutangulus]|uniref:Uncharacterized protein n=1 Tax=Anisodus acutangulus TaxID=402998 RepID=A0A9Q1L7R3_9SOLA|nr:hypothetical protein K7X08_035843 [Anisodus acutangulus]